MNQWDVRALMRSLSWEQLAEWVAYYEMSDFLEAEQHKGTTSQAALEKWKGILAIQEEARAMRAKQKVTTVRSG